MPTRYIPDLIRNIYMRNYHTILGVDISDISGAAQSNPANPYYYGLAEPVAQVSFLGEVLLFTAWERGSWDPVKQRWSEQMPPLMPKEALKVIADNIPSAMRKEDQDYLAGKAEFTPVVAENR